MLCPELPYRPLGRLAVFRHIGLEIDRAPVPMMVDAVSVRVDQNRSHGQLDRLGGKTLVPGFRLAETAAASVRRALGVGQRSAPAAVIGVEDLAGGCCEVAVAAEELRQGLGILERVELTPVVHVADHSGRRRALAEQQGRAGRIAQRCGTVGVGEQHPLPGQAVDVGCLRLRVASHAADPVVEIVNCDQQDVRAVLGHCGNGQQGAEHCNAKRHGTILGRIPRAVFWPRGGPP